MRLPADAKYTYGPVPSRRLGRSLGVSVIGRKVCTNSCIYCQLGRTRKRQIRSRSYFPRDEVLAEIDRKVAKTSPDCITFVGDGEPTLSSDLGWYIEQCKARWSNPVAVITNGCLLFREEVRENLLKADIVAPSLDAGDGLTFKVINRPHPSLEFEQVVQGLVTFREEFHGILRLEIMLVKGVNDNEHSLRSIRKLAWAVKPDRIDVAVPTRPPAEPWVMPPDPQSLIHAQRLFRSAETLNRPEDGKFEIAGFETLRDAVIGLSSRHPLRWSQARQLERAFGRSHQLEHLVQIGAISLVEYKHERFVTPPDRQKVDG
ncbi:MAG: radical SAM protein [Candidatus Zixiibacteriota bacterium]